MLKLSPQQFGEGSLGMVAGKFPHQVHVVRVWHLMDYPRQRQKWTDYFELFFGGAQPAPAAVRRALAPDTNVAGHRMFYARRRSADDEGVVGCARGGRAPKFSAAGAA
jgi:hypothetical protein